MDLLTYLNEHILRLDGGMGTQLQAQGLRAGEAPERWCLSRPEAVTAVHRAYLDAGADAVLTNTFGANLLKYSHGELSSVIEAAVRCAREAIASARADGKRSTERFVLLDIGPLGRMLKPYGDLGFEEAVSVFSETVRLGAACGVDGIYIETVSDTYEAKAALLAAREACSLPVLISFAFGADGRLLTGADAAAAVALAEGLGACAVGLNCSYGPETLMPIAKDVLSRASVPVIFKPNAGLPRAEGGQTVYDTTPEEFACAVREAVLSGVRVIGGCCGTTPAYIEAVTRATEGLTPLPVTQKRLSCVSSYTHAVTLGDRPYLIGERINPTGKPRFKDALRLGDMDYIVGEGISQLEAGAHMLDVNVGLPDIDECELLPRAVCALQAVVDAPLQIDTASGAAMERALRVYNGKPLINSVNGTLESMRTVFPLAQKYGGLVIALTLDEGGIPKDADGRVAIARRILDVAKEYGLGAHDLVFDPLAMAVSADSSAARETLTAVRRITEELGCHTSLGISNVSFGLPDREALNASYLVMALTDGLSCAIINPHARSLMRAYRTYLALTGRDGGFSAYIPFAERYPTETATAAVTPMPNVDETAENASELQTSIVKGRSERAATCIKSLLEAGRDPMAVVAEEIVPALNEVGRGFEEKRVYLPALLMSAEAASAATEVLRAYMTKHGASRVSTRFPVVLATVHGDIHDIGKNIVSLLLGTYGFEVHDLGRDVPCERIVDEAVRLHAPVVGLSALMTTTVPAMEQAVRALHERAPWCKVIVGGAVLTEEYAARIGADAYAPDAMAAVRFAEALEDTLAG